MKKSFVILSVILSMVFVACQKEIDWTDPNSTNNGQLLVKVHSKTGADSTVITYTYDGQNRLIREKIVGRDNGVDIGNDLLINRNGSGIITTTVQKNAAFAGSGIDSVITRYHYNGGSSRYTAAAFDVSIAGFSVTDSAVFSYDASGRITHDEHYITSGILPPFVAIRNEYTYSAGGTNVTVLTQKAATFPGDPLQVLSTQTYTFDTKSNPILIRNESLILTRPGFYNTNNPTKIVFDSPADPSVNFTMDYTYRYNQAGKPDSSYTTRTPGGAVTASKYFYQ